MVHCPCVNHDSDTNERSLYYYCTKTPSQCASNIQSNATDPYVKEHAEAGQSIFLSLGYVLVAVLAHVAHRVHLHTHVCGSVGECGGELVSESLSYSTQQASAPPLPTPLVQWMSELVSESYLYSKPHASAH